MLSQYLNVTDRQTDGQTDGQTTCDRNTALCTKVHRAVKMEVLVLVLTKKVLFTRLVKIRLRSWPEIILNCLSWFVMSWSYYCYNRPTVQVRAPFREQLVNGYSPITRQTQKGQTTKTHGRIKICAELYRTSLFTAHLITLKFLEEYRIVH